MVTTRARLVLFYKGQHMHAVPQRENGLRTSRQLSHCMLIAAPAHAHPIIVSDAAVNIAPDLD